MKTFWFSWFFSHENIWLFSWFFQHRLADGAVSHENILCVHNSSSIGVADDAVFHENILVFVILQTSARRWCALSWNCNFAGTGDKIELVTYYWIALAEIKRVTGLHMIKVKTGKENLWFGIILALRKVILDAGFMGGWSCFYRGK